MQESLQRLGETLPYLPDGETGERANYIGHLVDRLARNPALSSQEAMERLAGESRRTTRFSIRRGRKLEIELGELGYFRDWSASLPLFHKLRDEYGRPELRYQLGVAPALSIAFPFFRKPFSMRRAIGPLAEALRAEIGAAVRLAPDAAVVQLDAAIEQVAIARVHALLPSAARVLARRLARQLASLIVDVPPDVPVGVHLCLGNPGNRRVGHRPLLARSYCSRMRSPRSGRRDGRSTTCTSPSSTAPILATTSRSRSCGCRPPRA